MQTIDITPTWGEIGLLLARLAVSKEVQAFQQMRPDLARGMAAAQALKAIESTLTKEQAFTVDETLAAELRKQGF